MAPSTPWLRSSLPLVACVLLVSVVTWVRVPLLPEMGADLSMSATLLGWVVTAFGLGRLAMDLPAGRLADRVPALRLFALAALAMCLASILLAAAAGPAMAIVACLLIGAASATSNTTGMTAISAVAPAERRGSAMALYSGSLLVGQAVGPALAGILAGIGGWRVAAASGAGMALLVAAWAVAVNRRQISRGRVPGPRREPAPGPELTPLQHLVLFGVAFSVFFTVASVPQLLIPLIGAAELELSTPVIGLAIGAGGLGRAVGAFATGFVSDRFSRRWALLPCLALQAAGVGLLLLPAGVQWWLIAIIVMSLGSSGHAVGATMLADRTRAQEVGRALGKYRFAGDIGLVAGPVLVAATYEYAGPDVAVLGVCAVLVVGLLAAATVLAETHSGVRQG